MSKTKNFREEINLAVNKAVKQYRHCKKGPKGPVFAAKKATKAMFDKIKSLCSKNNVSYPEHTRILYDAVHAFAKKLKMTTGTEMTKRGVRSCVDIGTPPMLYVSRDGLMTEAEIVKKGKSSFLVVIESTAGRKAA